MMNGFTLTPFPLSLSKAFISTTRPCNTYDVLVSNVHCNLQEWGLIRSCFSFSVLKSGEDVAISTVLMVLLCFHWEGGNFIVYKMYLLSIQHKNLDPIHLLLIHFKWPRVHSHIIFQAYSSVKVTKKNLTHELHSSLGHKVATSIVNWVHLTAHCGLIMLTWMRFIFFRQTKLRFMRWWLVIDYP